ncbi:pyrazinamidase/nicotinamidase, putative [Plasmodium vivax]|uniref:nicotinamidase n=1 Tax=Plasmodium vivax (strain Salvador I) TaxID=126793 RepID=A5K7M2_PLAVS|nr:pyrazinamidase/nicotinamidase, putative [Plasmodium vivax]EDL44781.1 pyrazinamidase/nicotinamidase, putative [Plasmodium vivax]|eukprot:XP_001614508.1 pyrazinamidase/nicotinamidase [Plasmodium vivax Sal-1]
MKCFVIVDAQNDFLPKGSFNSRDDYMDALNKINAIRLRLHNCSERDLIKLSSCKHMMQYQPDKLLKENIVPYHQCSNDIDDAQREGDILLFPWDDRMAPTCPNGMSTLNGCNGVNGLQGQPAQGTVNGMPNGHHSGFSHTGEANSVALLNGTRESANGPTSDFALNILSVDYHPQYHISFAETHRIVFKQISKNGGLKQSSVRMNGRALTEVPPHAHVNGLAALGEAEEMRADEEEQDEERALDEEHEDECPREECPRDDPDGEAAHSQQAAFLKKHKIFTLTDVMQNMAKIKSTRHIYRNVNSPSDIKEYTKLHFLNESIDVWPVHCVRNTPGSKIHPTLIRHLNDIVIKKADTENHDSHTFFENEEINEKILKLLKGLNIKSVYICGFIFEYCVKETALSFLNLGFDTYIVEDATAYLFGREEDKDSLKRKGIKFVNSSTMFV